MNTTEADARTKWCPFARQMVTLDRERHGAPSVPIEISSANRFNNNDKGQAIGTLCLASDCMSWRWTEGATDISMTEPPEEEKKSGGWKQDGMKWVRDRVVSRKGRCGLAGDVEYRS